MNSIPQSVLIDERQCRCAVCEKQFGGKTMVCDMCDTFCYLECMSPDSDICIACTSVDSSITPCSEPMYPWTMLTETFLLKHVLLILFSSRMIQLLLPNYCLLHPWKVPVTLLVLPSKIVKISVQVLYMYVLLYPRRTILLFLKNVLVLLETSETMTSLNQEIAVAICQSQGRHKVIYRHYYSTFKNVKVDCN